MDNILSDIDLTPEDDHEPFVIQPDKEEISFHRGSFYLFFFLLWNLIVVYRIFSPVLSMKYGVNKKVLAILNKKKQI